MVAAFVRHQHAPQRIELVYRERLEFSKLKEQLAYPTRGFFHSLQLLLKHLQCRSRDQLGKTPDYKEGWLD